MNEHASSVIIHPGQSMPDILDRVTTPGGPGQYGMGSDAAELAFAYHSLGLGDQYKETYINHDTALTFSAVWACIRLISQSLAGVGWHVYEKSMDGRRKMPIEDDVAWTLDMQANPEMSAFEFRQVMLKDALTWGNGYAEIERTMGGRFLWLWRIAPERVELIRDEEGQLWYEIDNKGRTKTYLRPENVFHLRGLGPDGLVGWSVIEMARKAIQLGLYEEKFGLQFFRRGPMPGGFLTLPKAMTEQQRRETRRSFEELYSGSQNAHRVVVLSDGMTFNPASMPNEDAQFLQSRTFQINEICRWFGVPPHKVSEMSRATFSNIEEQNIEFVTDCLLAWASRLESEANIKCYTQRRQGRRYTRLNLDALMRGNSETQANTVISKVAGAVLTPNEGREYFDMNPVPEGDVLLVQGAMIPLERAIEEPPEPAPPAAPPMQPEPSTNGSGNGNGDTTEPTNRFEALSLVTSTANGFKLAEGLTAFDPDQERDEAGRFGSGGGGDDGGKDDNKDSGKSDSGKSDRESRREAEDNKVEDQRIDEDAQRDDDRQNEEANVQEERDKEDAPLEHAEAARQEQRDKEDEQRDAQRDEEDTKDVEDRQAEDARIQEQRDKEDAESNSQDEAKDTERQAEDDRIAADRDKEDAKDISDRKEEDAKIQGERERQDTERNAGREKEDAARETGREAEDSRIQETRDEQDAKTAEQREARDNAVDERADLTDEQRDAEHARNTAEEQKEDKSRDSVREKEDAKLESQRQAEDDRVNSQREKEDANRDSAREKEDEKRGDQRDEKDEKDATRREKEDTKRETQREKEDEKDREKRDEKRDAAREKEDEKRESQRTREDEKSIAEREKEDTRVTKEREKEDAQHEKAASQREKEREKEDKEREKRWEREDRERESVREKEDRERDRQRASEDRGAK